MTLAGLAEARQAAVSEETYKLYSAQLCEFDPEDVRTVVRNLASRKRADGETSFPSLGDLLGPLRTLRNRCKVAERLERERQERVNAFWLEILPHRKSEYGWTEAEALEPVLTFA